LNTSGQNWHRISAAPNGIGDLLLRNGSDPYQAAYIGRQADDGRWFSGSNGEQETRPVYFCLIPQFDANEDGIAA
jgi:hypothetical protein